MDEIGYLIKRTAEPNAAGDPVKKESRREVFLTPYDVGMKEFYNAAAVGLKPQKKFLLTDYMDYEGETLLEYEGRRYRIERGYQRGNALELTAYSEVNPDERT